MCAFCFDHERFCFVACLHVCMLVLMTLGYLFYSVCSFQGAVSCFCLFFDEALLFYHVSFSLSRFSRDFCVDGGDEEIRTPDPLLARQVLSQLSYTPRLLCFLVIVFCVFKLYWWAQVDSNHRPHAYQACALTS